MKFGVTDTRVGNVTNYDRLTLEVWTDGSLGPDEAVTSAAEILIKYLALFKTTNVPRIQGDEDGNKTSDEGNKSSVLQMSIDDLDLTVRSNNCLRRAKHQYGRRYHQQDGRRADLRPEPGQQILGRSQEQDRRVGIASAQF